MNKLLPILLVVVLSGCSSEPLVHSTTETMYFKCGETLPVTVNIKNKSISHYMEKMGLYFSWIQEGGAYYKVYDVKNKRLNYYMHGWTSPPESLYSKWGQEATGYFVILNDKKLACERIDNHDEYIK